MWPPFPSLLHPWMDGTKWYLPSLWSDNLGGWDVRISLVTLVDHLLKLLVTEEGVVSKYSALGIDPFRVALLVMNWGKRNWKVEWHEMYLRHHGSIAFFAMLSLFITAGGLGNCLVEIYICRLAGWFSSKYKTLPFSFFWIQTSVGSSMIRSAVYIIH